MATIWLTTMKPGFTNEWLALPPKEAHQVLEKINLLVQDPTPDAKVKKQLKYMNGNLHRIRSGDYRIFYTFEHRISASWLCADAMTIPTTRIWMLSFSAGLTHT